MDFLKFLHNKKLFIYLEEGNFQKIKNKNIQIKYIKFYLIILIIQNPNRK